MILDNTILAVEDELSEAIAKRILNSFAIKVTDTIRGGGNAYLREKAPELNRAANGRDIFLLTDLDSPKDCPPSLIHSWIKGPLHPRLIFRVAVMEVESWVIADRIGISNFLSIPIHRIPSTTDEILNPKEFLVSLARMSKKRKLRNDLIPQQGSKTPFGYGYNTRLSSFVRDHWDLERAATVSPSLKRTLDRLSYAKEVRTEQ